MRVHAQIWEIILILMAFMNSLKRKVYKEDRSKAQSKDHFNDNFIACTLNWILIKLKFNSWIKM